MVSVGPLHLAPPAHVSSRAAVDAFVACGGKADKTGHVSRENLVRIIKVDFGLTIDIEELIDTLVRQRSCGRATRVQCGPPPSRPRLRCVGCGWVRRD